MSREVILCTLIIGLSLYTIACTPAMPSSQFCPIPIHPDSQTKAWLSGLNPPDYVNRYFELIGDQQAAIDKACR